MTADSELPTGAILALCDKLLGEVGRRSHRFAWLRAPGAGADAWLPVDAYYPRHRLVVVCQAERGSEDHLFSRLVPEHGLRLLQFAREELGPDAEVAEQVLRRMIARLPPLEVPGHLQETHGRAARPRAKAAKADKPAEARSVRADERARAPRLPTMSLASLAAIPGSLTAMREPRGRTLEPPAAMARARAGTWQRPGPARLHSRRTRAVAAAHPEIVAVGVAAGLALAVVCGAELIAAVIAVALDSGRVVLGLGIACDACARALGTLDSERVGKPTWAWGCAIVGSPVVVAAAFLWPRPRRPRDASGPGQVPVEAAPQAGLLASLALVFILIGLVS